ASRPRAGGSRNSGRPGALAPIHHRTVDALRASWQRRPRARPSVDQAAPPGVLVGGLGIDALLLFFAERTIGRAWREFRPSGETFQPRGGGRQRGAIAPVASLYKFCATATVPTARPRSSSAWQCARSSSVLIRSTSAMARAGTP